LHDSERINAEITESKAANKTVNCSTLLHVKSHFQHILAE